MPEGSLAAGGQKGNELVYDRRWKRFVAAFTGLEAELVEAEVLWGSEIRGPEADLRKCFAELYAAVNMHLRMLGTPNPTESLTRVVEGQFRILYQVDSPDDPDVFGQRVTSAVKAFEAILRPRLALNR
jgi:hypothetical protein